MKEVPSSEFRVSSFEFRVLSFLRLAAFRAERLRLSGDYLMV
jgi:hypothetical protein